MSEKKLIEFASMPDIEEQLRDRMEALTQAQERQGTAEDRIQRLESQLVIVFIKSKNYYLYLKNKAIVSVLKVVKTFSMQTNVKRIYQSISVRLFNIPRRTFLVQIRIILCFKVFINKELLFVLLRER